MKEKKICQPWELDECVKKLKAFEKLTTYKSDSLNQFCFIIKENFCFLVEK